MNDRDVALAELIDSGQILDRHAARFREHYDTLAAIDSPTQRAATGQRLLGKRYVLLASLIPAPDWWR